MILIIQSLWNEALTSKLAQGAQEVLLAKKIPHRVIQVPGGLEIPLTVKWAWAKAQREQSDLQGVIACGAVIKGDTYHFEIVANESARALMNLSLELRLPIANAILTTYDIDQALERVGGSKGNKGEEAAHAVLEMIELKKKEAY